jgi:hypothetical protein
MSYTPIGISVASEVLEAMRIAAARFWAEWGSRYQGLSDDRKEQLQQELQQILEACRAAGGPAPVSDDHLVKARNADATTVGGLEEKTASSDTITRERFTDPVDGIEKVRFNTTPVQTTGGSWLYTGSIQATNLLDPVKAFLRSGYAGSMSGFGPSWDLLENGDFRRKDVGELYGLDTTGTETINLSVGDRAWLTFGAGDLDGGTNQRCGGICTVITLGDASTKAVVRPADTLHTGDMFKVEGVGAEYEGWYWEIDLDFDWRVISLYYRADYVSTTTYNLLTSTEVSRAGSITRETTVTIPGGTSGGTMFVTPYFEMLGSLGVATIPKGVVNWEVLAYVASDDPVATVFIRANLTKDQGILSHFGYGDTQAIHATTPTLLRCQGTIAADIACNPSDKLGAVFYGYSNSESDITIKLVYNSASHATRVQTPLETASYGTLDHQLLTSSSRGFTTGEEADASTYRHPMRAIAPGRILWDEGSTVATASGLLTLPAKSNAVRVSGSDTLLGIATAGFTPGTIIYLESVESRLVANGGTPGSGYDPLSVHVSMGMTASPSVFLWPANAGMVLKLTGGGNWLVLSAPWLEPQRALWPSMVSVTINATTAPGLLELPLGCPGAIYVTGTELRAITAKDAEGNFQAGPLADIKLFFANNCTLYHLDALSGWDAGLAARAAKLDLLPPEGSTGDAANVWVPARRTYRLQRDVSELLWISEVSQ